MPPALPASLGDTGSGARAILLRCQNWGDVRLALGDASRDAKGRVFELLVQHVLRISDELGFAHVWSTHGEVPTPVLKRLNLDGSDSKGIDLIAETDFGELVAVQCKYHQDEQRALTQKECEGLVAGMTLAKGQFLRGLVCTTATEHSRNLKYDIQYLKYERWAQLDEEFFRRLHEALRGQAPTRLRASSPRPHQVEAVYAAHRELVERGKDRCRVIMACATGKTHTAFFLAERLKARRVLIAVPNLSLADQHIQKLAPEYAARGLRAKWLAVCSDKTVGRDEDEAPSIAREDVRIVNVSTSAKEVSGWLRDYGQAERLVVFSTYQSGDVLAEAAKDAGFRFDLGIFDEAHRTAGSKASPFAYLLADDRIAISKRVFMTATEREYRGANPDVVGMNDVGLYGEKVFDLPTRAAVDQKIISDYRVVILACSTSATEELIRSRQLVQLLRWRKPTTAGMLAAGIGLRQVMKEYSLRHGLSFHSSLKRMAQFKELQDDLSLSLAEDFRPLKVVQFSGLDTASVRRANREIFETSSSALASNVRVFVEGVDCPEIDLVAFVDPKQSKIDIVQAVGRAIRRAKGGVPKVAYVFVPILVDEDGEPSNRAFGQVMTILRALKAKDESIADDVRVMFEENAWTDVRTRVAFRVAVGLELDAAKFARNLGTRIWEGSDSVVGLMGRALTLEDYKSLAASRGFAFLGAELPRNSLTPTLWLCSHGHRWRTSFSSIRQGSGCHYCSGRGRRGLLDYQALALRRGFEFVGAAPPERVTMPATWRCAKGHLWQAVYNNIRNGRGCPYCTGVARKSIADYRRLAATRGFEFLGELAPPSTDGKGPWRCSAGHVWQGRYSNISKGVGCPYCSGKARKTLSDYRALAESRGLEFLGESAPPTTSHKAFWRCPDNHVWLGRYEHISRGVGCPTCSGRPQLTSSERATKLWADYRAVANSRGFEFLGGELPATSQTPGPWRCAKGHVWQGRLRHISRGIGCPYCSGKGRRTLEDYFALAKNRGIEFVGGELPERTSRSTDWRCRAGHTWRTSYKRIQQGRGCPECSRAQRQEGRSAPTGTRHATGSLSGARASGRRFSPTSDGSSSTRSRRRRRLPKPR